MPWKPPEPGAVPTLGFAVIDWITANLAAPDRAEYEPFVLYPEQEDFVLRFYELDPVSGKRKYRRAVLSRPRGWGKSPLLAALAIAEAFADVVPDGWDAAGQPVGKPWAAVRTPLVQIGAVSETQTENTWTPLLEMLDGPVAGNYPGLEPLDTFVNLPRGKIEPITSSARTVKGNRPVFAVLDQTEEWVPSNGGPKLASTMRINAAKIGGTTVESPNAFTPGEDSVAEASASYWTQIREGRAKDDGLYCDHREAPPDTDMEDRSSLLAGLAYVYGDSADVNGGHVDLDRIVRDVWDPSIDPQISRADFLNQITHAPDAWLSQPEWAGCVDLEKVVADRDVITLGFDGSRGRARGKADATALVGCRVADGHVFDVAGWEPPEGAAGRYWQVPVAEVDAAVRDTFGRYTVVGFYADPTMWDEHVAGWEARYGARLRVHASSKAHPVRWPKTQMAQVCAAVKRFHDAAAAGELTHDGSYPLTRHVLNARRRTCRSGIYIGKEFPDSARKIDRAYAGILAWQARLAAVSAGAGSTTTTAAPRRIR